MPPDTAIASTPVASATYEPALPLASITPSKTNPRKRFNQAAIDELAASIKVQGVVQPVLVRPIGVGVFELVVGERRFRASKAAGATTIPATVRELSDIDVIEIQIIENLQREDVHPIEEAEGYEQLMRQTKPGSKDHFTADEIAAKVGKSRRYVFDRLALLKLCPDVREACFADTIDISKALLIARIDNAETQKALLKRVTTAGWNKELPTFREIRQFILRDYMTGLKDAKFDIKIVDYKDAKGKLIAGPCGTCPKRSGANPDLFNDIEDADVCTDIKCFAAKRESARKREADGYAAKGFEVITGKEAKKLLPQQWSNNAAEGYVSGAQTCRDDTKGRSYSELVGKAVQPIMVLKPESNEFVKVWPVTAIGEALKKAGVKPSAPVSDNNPRAKREDDDRVYKQRQLMQKARIQGYLKAREAFAAGASEAAFRLMISIALEELLDYGSDLLVIGPTYLPGADLGGQVYLTDIVEDIRAAIAKLPAEALPRALLDILVDGLLDSLPHEVEPTDARFVRLDLLLGDHKVDVNALMKQIEAEAAVKAAKPAKKVPVIEPLIKAYNPLLKANPADKAGAGAATDAKSKTPAKKSPAVAGAGQKAKGKK